MHPRSGRCRRCSILKGCCRKNVVFEEDIIKVRFTDTEDQIKARELIADELGNSYSVALALMPATPDLA